MLLQLLLEIIFCFPPHDFHFNKGSSIDGFDQVQLPKKNVVFSLFFYFFIHPSIANVCTLCCCKRWCYSTDNERVRLVGVFFWVKYQLPIAIVYNLFEETSIPYKIHEHLEFYILLLACWFSWFFFRTNKLNEPTDCNCTSKYQNKFLTSLNN